MFILPTKQNTHPSWSLVYLAVRKSLGFTISQYHLLTLELLSFWHFFTDSNNLTSVFLVFFLNFRNSLTNGPLHELKLWVATRGIIPLTKCTCFFQKNQDGEWEVSNNTYDIFFSFIFTIFLYLKWNVFI